MNVSIVSENSETVAVVCGEVDADNCAEFARKLLDSPATDSRLVIDAAGLTFIDSSGISELLRVREVVNDRGQELELRAPSTAVRRVLEITGLSEHFGLD